MTEINRSALLHFPAEKLYHLINDIAAYPQYLAGCTAAEVLSSTETSMEARLDLARGGMAYSFTTRNSLQPYESITMELIEGPFTRFDGQWLISALGDAACKVSLRLSFELDSSVLSAAAKVMFNSVADNLVDAMVERAKQVYG